MPTRYFGLLLQGGRKSWTASPRRRKPRRHTGNLPSKRILVECSWRQSRRKQQQIERRESSSSTPEFIFVVWTALVGFLLEKNEVRACMVFNTSAIITCDYRLLLLLLGMRARAHACRFTTRAYLCCCCSAARAAPRCPADCVLASTRAATTASGCCSDGTPPWGTIVPPPMMEAAFGASAFMRVEERAPSAPTSAACPAATDTATAAPSVAKPPLASVAPRERLDDRVTTLSRSRPRVKALDAMSPRRAESLLQPVGDPGAVMPTLSQARTTAAAKAARLQPASLPVPSEWAAAESAAAADPFGACLVLIHLMDPLRSWSTRRDEHMHEQRAESIARLVNMLRAQHDKRRFVGDQCTVVWLLHDMRDAPGVIDELHDMDMVTEPLITVGITAGQEGAPRKRPAESSSKPASVTEVKAFYAVVSHFDDEVYIVNDKVAFYGQGTSASTFKAGSNMTVIPKHADATKLVATICNRHCSRKSTHTWHQQAQSYAVVAARVDASTQSAGQRGAALAAEQQQQSSSPKYLVGINHYRPRHFHSTSCGTAAAAVVLGSSGAAAAAAEAASVAVSSRARTRVDQNPCLLQLLLFCLSKVIAVLVHRVHEQPTVMLMAVAMHFCDCLQTDHFGCREGLS
ncbi:hypothetical protein JKP88DRAFT_297552 [Tribonema minus]|uniref:Uncharacterized protein n=1 Tax=Tribonema minus TaxID=303371 RepID=A0A835ZBZ7_9STRA|nr:hypothetical protein JKP88DRAFT_297552 [Tribonema minus]